MSGLLVGYVLQTDWEPVRKIVMVAICDHADDEGDKVFPSVARLARKASVSERTVQRVIGEMKQLGIMILVSQASGLPGQANEYRIDVDKLTESRRVTHSHPSGRGDTAVTRGVTEVSPVGVTVVSPETSYSNRHITVIEDKHLPSVGVSADLFEVSEPKQKTWQQDQEEKADRIGISIRGKCPPGVPAIEMVEAYHEILPGSPRCLVLPSGRLRGLSARFADCGGSLEAWRGVLRGKVAASPFLTGSVPGRHGSKPFRACLDWIIGPENFVKIVEGQYVEAKPDYSNVE